MKRPRSRKAEGRSAQSKPTATRDKLRIWGWIIGIFLLLAIGLHFVTTRDEESVLTNRLAQWKSEYHLNESQMGRIRAMEEKFHGSGDPFSLPAHTPDEVRAHHRAIALEMNPSEGARFFHDREGVELVR